MKVIFMGSPEFAVPALEKLIQNKFNIIAVYTQPDKPAGRGKHLVACPVKIVAQAHGLNVLQPARLKDTATVEQLVGLQPDIIVIAAYGHILPDAVLEAPVHKCLNIHPSLLPKYRGASPVAAAILNGDAVTGVTLMLVEKVVDSGPILLQREIKVADDDTTESLTTKLAQLGAEMLVEILPDWLAGRITPVMQDHSQASFTHKESKEDGLMDWNLPAEQLWRRVRAFHPWPGSYILWKGNRVKIIKTMPIAVEIEAPPGQVVMLPRTYPVRVAVRAAGSVLGLITVQPEGKREMSGQEFASGHRDFIGSLL